MAREKLEGSVVTPLLKVPFNIWRVPQYERVKPSKGRRRGDEPLEYNNRNRLWNEMKDSEKGILKTIGEEDTSNPFGYGKGEWARSASG
jgi:hypothetical protein